MTAVAKRAGVSEPTVYRHFPTKRDLFAALARRQFQAVAAGLAPASPDDLGQAVHTVFRRSAEMENTVRWTLAAPAALLGVAASPSPDPRPLNNIAVAQITVKH